MSLVINNFLYEDLVSLHDYTKMTISDEIHWPYYYHNLCFNLQFRNQYVLVGKKFFIKTIIVNCWEIRIKYPSLIEFHFSL